LNALINPPGKPLLDEAALPLSAQNFQTERSSFAKFWLPVKKTRR
jgi:hypothetical protein